MILLGVVSWFVGCGLEAPSDSTPEVPAEGAGSSLVEAGRRIFREGIGTAGEPIQAVVLGDVPFDATNASCMSCHGRAGMGTPEQDNRTPPIAGPLLFGADAQLKRPAYTESTLARALREGVDPAGRHLDPLMPRFPLDADDMTALTAYLRSLGAEPSPGADDDNVRIATVIAGDVPADERQQMMAVLERFVEVKNAEVRGEQGRAYARREDGRAFIPYRVWTLDVWELDGDPDTWQAQAQARYDAEPVFAVLSGLAEGPWAPLHTFCEANQVVCLLPNTDWVPDPGDDFYTMYFSGGLRLEAEIMASDLVATNAGGNVVQYVPAGDDEAAAAAQVLTGALSAAGGSVRSDGSASGVASALGSGASAVVWWGTDASDLPATSAGSAPVYLSATRLGGSWDAVPEGLAANTRVVNLYRTGADPGLTRFLLWSRTREVEVTNQRLQAQTWFACIALLDGLKHISRYPQRDFLLDNLDHAAGMTAFLPVYPRGNLGPGQRWLAKGGAVVDLSGATDPRWVVP